MIEFYERSLDAIKQGLIAVKDESQSEARVSTHQCLAFRISLIIAFH
jgi:hypothetical protein